MPHRAALFLDFDNVFTALIERDVAAAAAFVQDPMRWIGWLESLGASPGGPPGSSAGDTTRQRRILVRRCYLNPIAKVLVPGEDRPRYFSSFRNAFVRAGFQMVDCPPLTQGGKTSADMVMVMDILDTLAHPTGFEDFIILSSDADFTPVLLRLRAHDRRGIVIATGASADAYRAAAEVVVGYDEFASGALGLSPPVAQVSLRSAILAEVKALVAAAPEPLPQAWVAQQVIKRLGREVLDSDWAGAGGFRALLMEEAQEPGLALDRSGGGWLLDPARHQPAASLPASLPAEAPAADPRLVRMAALVRRLLALLGNIPMLGPDRLDFLLEHLATRLPIPDPSAQEIRGGISEAARAEGLEISPGAVNAVMHRIGLAGFDWQAPAEPDTPRRLRAALLDNIHQQMQQQKLDLSAEDAALLEEWVGLGGGPAEPATAPAAFSPPEDAAPPGVEADPEVGPDEVPEPDPEPGAPPAAAFGAPEPPPDAAPWPDPLTG